MLRRKFLQFFGLAPAVALTPREWIEKETEVPYVQTKFTELSKEETDRIAKVFSQYVGNNVSGIMNYSGVDMTMSCGGTIPNSTKATGKR